MQFKQTKDYYQHGIITGFVAIKDGSRPGNWLLSMTGKDDQSWTLKTTREKQKSFVSLDSLIKEVERITGDIESLTINPQN